MDVNKDQMQLIVYAVVFFICCGGIGILITPIYKVMQWKYWLTNKNDDSKEE